MHNPSKVYWRGLDELQSSNGATDNSKSEFPEFGLSGAGNDSASYRRDFLKLMGFGVAAATLAACETPVRKAIPYLIKPEEVDPTIPNWYASTFQDGGDYCSIVVKTREGRPIKIEGNKNSSISRGAVSARVQASVLSLYDKERLRAPKIGDKNVTWEEFDSSLIKKLNEVKATGKSSYVVANTILSPSLNSVLSDFLASYNAKLVMYDPTSFSGMLEANKSSFGTFSLPSYDFSKAETIVSFSADFLGTWLSPVEFAKQYASMRKIGKSKKTMSRHFQFETTMSLTGSNADFRTPIRPSQEGLLIANLYNLIATKLGQPLVKVGEAKDVKNLNKAAEALLASKGKSLVIAASNDTDVQVLINSINSMLGNYGSTLTLSSPSYYKKGSDSDFLGFVSALKSGAAGAVLFLGSNPVYDSPLGQDIKAALSKVPVSVAITDRPSETSVLCGYVAADHHFLESWSDACPRKGFYSLGQPTISPLFKTRPAIETLSILNGNNKDAYALIQSYWESSLFPMSGYNSFSEFWDTSLYFGVFELGSKLPRTSAEYVAFTSSSEPQFVANVQDAASKVALKYTLSSQELEFTTYETVAVGSGSQANNPWLQELPDPVTKACWDNYILVSAKMAQDQSLSQGDIVRMTVASGKSIELPILVQPGQAPNTVSVAVGYGREVAGKVANGLGQNAFGLNTFQNGLAVTSGKVTAFEKTGATRQIAQTQTHHTMMSRPIVQESTLGEYIKNPLAGRNMPMIETSEGKKSPEEITMWNTQGLQTHTYNNHFWGLAIDLNSCIGCGACVIGCQAENNVPVVGRQEVLNRREMHWIRIDRYYSSDALNQEDKSVAGLMDAEREVPGENPAVVYQPVMCQHCNNAPCETVCPVLATTHSTEGLNQMTYNRCIGTRYCANNCPYKVRRFNWFSYYTNTERGFQNVNPAHDSRENEGLGKMVLNPDVTVRARGVMEKCSMCVQRIQAGKLQAKLESRRPVDGEIETACSQSCPTDAIVFGDMNDPQSRISKVLGEENKERAYHLLEELNTKPSVSYLTKIRNI